MMVMHAHDLVFCRLAKSGEVQCLDEEHVLVLAESAPELLDGTTGKMRIFVKQIGEFQHQLDLQDFPFDEHHLKVFLCGSVPRQQLRFKDLEQSKLRIYSTKGCAWKVRDKQTQTPIYITYTALQWCRIIHLCGEDFCWLFYLFAERKEGVEGTTTKQTQGPRPLCICCYSSISVQTHPKRLRI